MAQNYRVDKKTGAVIFKKSAEIKQAQQTKQLVEELKEKVEVLEKENVRLNRIIKRKRWIK